MSNIETLGQELCTMIDSSNCTFADIVNLLEPLADYISDVQFTTNVTQIINLIMVDRNNDNQFTFDDVKLLSSDISAVTSIISCTLAVIASLPSVQVATDCTQDLLFKILPSKSNLTWTNDEKKTIVNIVLTLYNLFVTSGLAQNLINKIKQLFISKGWCKCLCVAASPTTQLPTKGSRNLPTKGSLHSVKQQILNNNLPKMMLDLGKNLTSFKSMSILRHSITKTNNIPK